MRIDYIHFYLKDTASLADWFREKIGCTSLMSAAGAHTHTEVLKTGSIYFVLSSPITQHSPAYDYLSCHPAGVVDVALRVEKLEPILAKAARSESLQPVSELSGPIRWAKIRGWGDLTHTLIEGTAEFSFCEVLRLQLGIEAFLPDRNISAVTSEPERVNETPSLFAEIDHVVLNVPAGSLQEAVNWYRDLFDFDVKQTFNIQTQHSGLKSQVLGSKSGKVYFNINEPTSASSQIQKFLEANQGSGIQHIALRTHNIVKAVAHMQQQGQVFLSVPPAYYAQLERRLKPALASMLKSSELNEIQDRNILVDGSAGQPTSLLLQIFTQPLFEEPTFFMEIIERRQQARGFGEGNFRALFEAIETEQTNGEQRSSTLE